LTIQSVDFDAEFPLDDGENAAVTLTNEIDAELFYVMYSTVSG